MEPLENLKKVRLEKLEKIKSLGINPYPSKSRKTQSVSQAREMMGQKVSIAGRIMAIRGHGGVQFFDLRDESGKIQLVLKKDKLSIVHCQLLNFLDIGDFIGVEGKLFNTQAGELTVEIASYTLLTKSLRPLPSAWYGFKDVEERYRKRYLDLIMNQKSKDILVKRSQITNSLRKFLIEKKGYVEVENPVLQPIYGGGRAKPFITHHNTLDTDFYLRISNELYLKRLIVGGLEKVFEINHIFRNEGMDRNHNPEFTMLETMEAYADYNDNMDLVEEMFEFVALDVFGTTKLEFQGTVINYKRPWKRIKLSELFKKYTGLNLNDVRTVEKATDLAKKLGVHIEDFMTDGEILLEIFEKKCTSELIQPTFVYDFPADFYPLAKRCGYDDRFVESFDIYVAGMEMGTNWSEQNDPAILRKTWEEETKKAAAGNQEAQKFDKDFLEALEYGMPPTSGIGPGIDRWAMVMTNSPSISDVIMFPTMKPEKLITEETPKIKISGTIAKDFTGKNIFIIDPAVKEKFPGMLVGVALIKNLTIKKQDEQLEELKKEAIDFRSSLTEEEVGNLPSIAAYRKLFRDFGIDWHSRHPSPDALLLRIAQKKGLYNINTLVDAYNVASLKTAMGMGAFDFSKVTPPVVLRLSTEGEKILLLGGEETKTTKEGELIYSDQEKVVTLDLNYRDCDQTKITTSTKEAIVFVDGAPGITGENISTALDLEVQLITKFCGGEVVFKEVALDIIKYPSENLGKEVPHDEEANRFVAVLNKKVDLGIDHQKAMELLEQYLKDPVNRKHSLESEAIMRALAKRLGEDQENWGIIGLLHDIDWEMTKDDTKKHCIKTAEILKMAGGTPYLIETIQSHGYGQGWGDNYYGPPEFADKQRTGNVQHALAAAETLTGLIVATALIQPDKKLESVKLDSLQKKFKNQKFAANCSRNIISECEKIGLTIEEFLEIGLNALQDISSVLGL